MSSSLLLVLLAFALVFLNGFFVAAEFGLVKLRATQVKAMARIYGWRGRILEKTHSNLDAYLSACQLGITLASLGLGWVGEPAFAQLIEPLMHALGVTSIEIIHGVSFAVAFFTISFLHIVVGELAPKSLAIRRSAQIGLWTAPPLYAFYWTMYPAIWALNTSATLVLKVVGLGPEHGHDSEYSADELKLILRSSKPDASRSRKEWRVLAQSLDFPTLDVADLMHPFTEAVCLDAREPLEANLDRMAQHRYSRYPYLNQVGKVEGIVHVKDIFLANRYGRLGNTLDPLVRPAEVVPPTLMARDLLDRLRRGAPHFAIVAYGDGEPLGFITMDNLLSAMVGEIRDEFRQNQDDWTMLDDGSMIGKGNLPVITLERALGVDIESGDADTVGGLVQLQTGRVPDEGERIEFDAFSLVIKKMRGPRILLVRVYPKTDELAGG
ncbi:hemolysin family protein [Amantichitinum ursilacus]|uniref:Hemolysin C n=1 Tax=Amantichitinum ursilacus TaxID=857265 RepID=A0A0N0GMS0_9NEIS|nr:hemolysin family protein [Amantichitinum ursilacus]KPC52031.1 Hemolysin C [Amantichitinum ursilacus]